MNNRIIEYVKNFFKRENKKMAKFNLKKIAQNIGTGENQLEECRDKVDLSNEKQGVVNKNINLSMPIKDKDNNIPFNVQLEAERKNETEFSIIESSMDDKIVDAKSKDKKQVMDINVKSQEYDDAKTKAYKEAEDKKAADTSFWDKYVGVQMEGKITKVDDNIPASASQLPNKEERFKEKEIEKMVMSSLKDADAMLLHIYANSQNRKLTADEEQQIIDIDSGKLRILAQMVEPFPRNLPYTGDREPTIRKDKDGKARVYEDGNAIDEFKSCGEAKANYPEGEIENA